MIADFETGKGDLHEDLRDEQEAVYEALVLGTRDYIRKCGFSTRADRSERRHRFFAYRAPSPWKPSAGERHRRRHARPILLATTA